MPFKKADAACKAYLPPAQGGQLNGPGGSTPADLVKFAAWSSRSWAGEEAWAPPS
ncbi:hypothetical protein [Streptacidiphilus sp. PAMC 29251]